MPTPIALPWRAVLWHNGEAHLIRQAESFDDLVKNQVVMAFDAVEV